MMARKRNEDMKIQREECLECFFVEMKWKKIIYKLFAVETSVKMLADFDFSCNSELISIYDYLAEIHSSVLDQMRIIWIDFYRAVQKGFASNKNQQSHLVLE